MGHVELSRPGLLRGTNPRLWRAEVKPPGAESAPSSSPGTQPGAGSEHQLWVQLQQLREERGAVGHEQIQLSKAQHRSTRKPPELSPGSSLAHEVPLINLIKYFIRAVMGSYQVLTAILPSAEHSPKGSFPQSQAVRRLIPFIYGILAGMPTRRAGINGSRKKLIIF